MSFPRFCRRERSGTSRVGTEAAGGSCGASKGLTSFARFPNYLDKKVHVGLNFGTGQGGRAVRLRHPLFQETFGIAAATVIRLWHTTLRVRTLSLDSTLHPLDPNRQPCVYAIWHDSIFAVLRARTEAVGLVSQHHDGELIARTARWLGFATIRGSSTRGGAAALREIQERSEGRHLLITPDGPRGPRHKVKPGVIYVAQALKRPVVFMGIGYDRFWAVNSWDRACLPKPFGTIYAVFSEPIELHTSTAPLSLAEWCCRMENRFIQISRIAWHWSRTRQRPVPGAVCESNRSPMSRGANRDEVAC